MKQIEKHPAPEKLLQQITEEAINSAPFPIPFLSGGFSTGKIPPKLSLIGLEWNGYK